MDMRPKRSGVDLLRPVAFVSVLALSWACGSTSATNACAATCGGCCDAQGSCLTSSAEHCGQHGEACLACGSDQRCAEGICASASTPGSGSPVADSGPDSGPVDGDAGLDYGTADGDAGLDSGNADGDAGLDAGTPGSDAGTVDAGSPHAPVILSLDVNSPFVTLGGTVVVSALVTDPDGLSDLVGGRLLDDASDQFVGAFTLTGGGSYTLNLTWPAAPSPVLNTAAGGLPMTYRAEFTDNEGHVASATVKLQVRCADAAQAICKNLCVDLQTSGTNCGSCGTVISSPRICRAGQPACPATTDGFCGGACVNLQTDSANCGGCGQKVSAPQICRDGKPACPTATDTFCNGACVNEQTDPNNCGGCGVVVTPPRTCLDGAPGCASSRIYCPASNVCTDLGKDNSNCGACGTVVPPPRVCSGGLPSCQGLTYCSSTNVCVNTDTNAKNCGACDHPLVPPQNVCRGGVPTCDNTPTNCGGCGNVCPVAAGASSLVCQTGQCFYTFQQTVTASTTNCGTICYSLGTTAVCKGGLLTHNGFISNWDCSTVPYGNGASLGDTLECSCRGQVF